MRREILISIGLLASAAGVLVWAGRGGFRSMMAFPHIFAGLVIIGAIYSLMTKPRTRMAIRVPLAIAIAVVALLASAAHTRFFLEEMRANEARAMRTLGGEVAPSIAYLHGFGTEPGGKEVVFGGRVTVVNFWATWCGACVSEIPLLEGFWEQNRDAGIDVLGVTKLYEEGEGGREEIAEIAEFLADLDVSYPVVVDSYDSQAHRDYDVFSLPSSVLIDRDGRVVDYGAGVAGTKRLLRAAVTLESAR